MKFNVCSLSVLLLLIGCLGNSNKNNKKDSIEVLKNDTNKIPEKTLLYSTKDLLDVQLLSLEELIDELPNISLPSRENEISILNEMVYLIIGKYKEYNIIIECFEGDNLVYYIGCVKKELFYMDEGVNVSPEWEEPENGKNCYEKRNFELYSDYLLKIETEEMLNGIKKLYTKYYRINDSGEFYEVKE